MIFAGRDARNAMSIFAAHDVRGYDQASHIAISQLIPVKDVPGKYSLGCLNSSLGVLQTLQMGRRDAGSAAGRTARSPSDPGEKAPNQRQPALSDITDKTVNRDLRLRTQRWLAVIEFSPVDPAHVR